MEQQGEWPVFWSGLKIGKLYVVGLNVLVVHGTNLSANVAMVGMWLNLPTLLLELVHLMRPTSEVSLGTSPLASPL